MTSDSELTNRIRAFAREQTPALAGGPALLAVSGGADSIATAVLLAETAIIDPKRCVVAHFDHRLRDDASARRDRAAVDPLCSRYGFSLETGMWEDPRAGEAAARDARYAFLAAAARRRRVGVIVTGHTADDQAETVVMNLMRGAGLRGVAGMSAERSIGADITLARPMLCASRAQTRAYCDEHGLAYHDDPSNADRGFLRNCLRLDLLPRIDAASPDARASLLRLADEARDSVAALDTIAAAQLAAATVDEHAASITLSRAALRGVVPAVAPYVWRLALVRLLGDAREFQRRHYDVLVATAHASTGRTFELARGVRVAVDAATLTVSCATLVEPTIATAFEAGIPFEGEIGAWRICVVRADDAAASTVLPPAAVVRGRRPGDRIQPRGMRGHKKLQDYYVDRKIARRHRDAAPVIVCGREVLWTPFGAAEPCGAGEAHRIAAERMT